MTVYNYSQLEQLWINAGGAKSMAPLMAAIAMAESGGNSASNNYQDNHGTQTSWGLWQISNGTHSWPGALDPNNPQNNARYAVQKLAGQGLGAWGTYTSGLYKQYLQGGVAPTSPGPSTGGGGGPTGEHSGPGSPGGIPGVTVSSSTDAFDGILAKAKAGALTYPDFLSWWNNKGAFEQSATQTNQVNQILAAVKTTEPNQSWVKSQLVTVNNGRVTVMLQTTPAYPGQSVIDSAAQNASNTGADLFALVSVFNDFFNYLKAIIGLIVNPAFWLRVVSGLGGFVILVIAGYMISTAS